MSCYHPLKAFPIGRTKNGKIDYKICDYSVDHLELDSKDNWQKCFDKFRSPNCRQIVNEFVEIPCGHCIGCKLEYSKQWANRCMLELQYHESSYFITLTYDDEHLPRPEKVNEETGEITNNPTLQKKDWQDFMKRLRKNYKYDNKLRFFMAGEYGSETFRPHYHAIIFGLKLDDLIPYSKSSCGYQYYNSAFLQKCWNKGYVVIGEVTWETCAYTARYVMKKANDGLTELYSDLNIQSEFTLMSRKPGIAKKYFDEHPDCMNFEYINISTENGGQKFKPPRYFEKHYEILNPEQAVLKSAQKEQLNLAEFYKRSVLSETSLDYRGLLQVEENNKKRQIKALRRKEI